MTFDKLMEELKASPGGVPAWRTVYLWTDRETGYYIDAEYSTTSDEYEAFKKEYFEYTDEIVLASYYCKDMHGDTILSILLLREDPEI